MAIEVLLYGITGLIVINGVAVLLASWLIWKSGQVDEYKRLYWKEMLERAQAENARQSKEAGKE
jgi:hypothetical protein